MIERAWCMPRHKTFEIKPIKKLLDKELPGEFLDPFPYPYQKDALEYLKSIETESIQHIAFDPPYSQRQLREMYDNIGQSVDMNNGYWAQCKDEITRIIKPGGKCISFGWNSAGIGKNRGFEITRILIVAHGSMHNDTICTVETKSQTTLQTEGSSQ